MIVTPLILPEGIWFGVNMVWMAGREERERGGGRGGGGALRQRNRCRQRQIQVTVSYHVKGK